MFTTMSTRANELCRPSWLGKNEVAELDRLVQMGALKSPFGGLMFSKCSARIRANRAFALVALEHSAAAYSYLVLNEFCGPADRELCIRSCQKSATAFYCIPHELLQDEVFVAELYGAAPLVRHIVDALIHKKPMLLPEGHPQTKRFKLEISV